jgi:phosphoenolpyruvate-protein phosphotransferase
MSDLILVAPIQGWVTSLDEAPDAVFAERMLGDGLAIDPTGSTLHAPCDGHVIGVHHTRHAVTLRAVNGAEILMHIGLETVSLAGEGFEVHVSDGQRVAAGDRLISFDIDLLARRAKSLITPIVITNGDDFAIASRDQDHAVQVGDFLMTLRPTGAVAAEAPAGPREVAVRRVVVALSHGIHARPAAVISAAAKRYAAEVSLMSAGKRANAKSPVALMALGVRFKDQIGVSATGDDAEAAVAAIARLLLSDMEAPAAAAPPAPRLMPREAAPEDLPANLLKGVTAAPGLAVGVAAQLVVQRIAIDPVGRGVAEETAALAGALAAVKARLEDQSASGPHQRRNILAAHLALLDDPELIAVAQALIDLGRSAGGAWREAVDGYVQVLRDVGDRRIAERIDDLIDLERQVLVALSGAPEPPITLPQGAILIADDLLPSQLMALDAGLLAGLCTARGGPTSHVAILAAAMGLPAVVALGAAVLKVADGARLVLDADTGLIDTAPDDEAWAAAETRLAAHRARRAAAQAAAGEDCRMADGTRIEVFANLGSQPDAAAAVAAGAEGCGLLRTEFLFLERETAPDEDEQLACYQAIANTLGGRPLIIRTLDIGGDKPVAYLPIPAEDNPALGLRGVRVGLWRPDVMRTQLRAILRVKSTERPWIMVPMIAGLSELTAVRAMLDAARAELGDTEPIKLGVMVETPAAAMTVDLIGAEADFISIGTNDLAQYALAMDRTNPLLAAGVDGLHPAVLRLIGQAVEGARRHGRTVGVCGGLASDLAAAPILIGLGVTELSATPTMAPELKALIRTLTATACADLAREALAQSSAAAVRGLSIAKTQPLAFGRGAA